MIIINSLTISKIKIILFILFVIFFQNITFGSTIVFLQEKITEYPLSFHMEILEDNNNSLSINNITDESVPKNFISNTVETPNFGYTDSAYWIKVQFENKSNNNQWFLEIQYPLLDHIELYKRGPDNKIIKKLSGDAYNFSTREIDHRNFIFPLLLPRDKQEIIYLRIKSESTMLLPLILRSNESLLENTSNENFIFGLYYGIMLVMIFYNLFIFTAVRDKSYIYYVSYIAGFSIFQMILSGFAFEFFWPDYPWWGNKALPFFVGFSLLSGLLFTKNFLNTKINAPKLDKTIIVLSILNIIFMFISLTARYSLSIRITGVISMVTVSTAVFAGIICLKKNYRPARYFMLAWAMLLTGTILFTLKSFGILPSVFMTNYIPQIGSALEVLLLSLGLADRINEERRQKFLAQKEALDNLNKADLLKNEFLANTSHELRTPLNGIIGIAESLIDGAMGEISEKIKKNLLMISTSGRRLSALVNDILDFSKLKNKEINLSLKSLDVRTVADVVLTISTSLLGPKPVKLINSIGKIPPVLADENRLQQILMNIIGNAIKFTEKGHIEISADNISNEKIAIKISDTGIGIHKNNLDRIFESFEQENGSTERKYGGTGLGLAITKDLVKLHNGSISVESEIGVGSTFTIILPAAKENPENIETDQSSRILNIKLLVDEFQNISSEEKLGQTDKEKSNFTILAVDDDVINLQVLSNLLSLERRNVITTTNGKEALEILESNSNIDLVLLDIMMPEMSGYEVCHIIRKEKKNFNLPIILLTAKNQTNDLTTGFATGANDYIMKPFTKEELMSRINFHIEFSKNAKSLKKITEELKELNLHLEDKVNERTLELHDAYKNLEIKNKIIEQKQNIAQVDMKMAINVQTSYFHNKNLFYDNWDVSFEFKPMSGISGDLYDFYQENSDLCGVSLFDVSGHGIASGLITMLMKPIVFRNFNKMKDKELNQVVEKINKDIILEIGNIDHYLTGIMLRFRNDEIEYVNAAHTSMIYKNIKSNETKIVPIEKGSIIGIELMATNYESTKFQINPHDSLLLYTDGIIEAKNKNKEPYGIDRLINTYQDAPENYSSNEIIKYIIDDYYNFIDDPDSLPDDLTIIALKKK